MLSFANGKTTVEAAPPRSDVAPQGSWGSATHLERVAHLGATGLVGTALVGELRATDQALGGHLVVELDLLITLDGEEPYAVTHREPVSLGLVGALTPGSSLPVRVDPSDHQQVLLQWAHD